jgi:4'-phosphopantetheinyl transferase
LNSPAAIIEWPLPPAKPQLAENEIHVWATTLAPAAAVLDQLASTLAPEEKERANRFKFEQLRNRYIAGRGALRAILAQYVGTNPSRMHFAYLQNGKPVLGSDFATAGIHFNLTHTGDLALIAITRLGLIGVDVEYVRPIKNADELVARFFSKREDELFQKVSEEQKPVAFFNLWTRKEALLKATGEGITRSLSLVEVSFLPGEPARLIAISGDAKAANAWVLKALALAKGFAGAVAVCWGTSNVEHRMLNIEGGKSNVLLGEREIVLKCWKLA